MFGLFASEPAQETAESVDIIDKASLLLKGGLNLKSAVLTEFALREKLEALQSTDHIALLYENREDQLAAVVPFVQVGLDRGEHCIYAVDDLTRQEILTALSDHGIDTTLYTKTGALAVVGKKDTYLRNQVFDPDEMIRFLQMSVKAIKSAGFTGCRGTGELTWALDEPEGLERVIDYETKLDKASNTLQMHLLCQYNLNRFPPETILDVIRTHPVVIYKGRLCENDFYVPPRERNSIDPVAYEVRRQLDRIYSRAASI